MSRAALIGVALAAALFGVVSGYRGGAGSWPFQKHAAPATNTEAPAARRVLYWKHPDGAADFSPVPKKTDDGRDYRPVYDEEEPQLAGVQTATPKSKGKILYYRNPMGLADTSPVPKKDWMGMDYIPVYEGEDQDAGTVKVSLARVQRTGVRTEAAAMRVLARPVRAPGIAKPDERTLRTLSLRADGFIEKLYVNATGQHVQAGDPLFRIYSPELVRIQVDYRVAMTSGSRGPRDEAGALQRLRNLEVPESVIQRLRVDPNPTMSIDWPSPASGIVMLKAVIEGQRAKAGDELFRFADLSSIWVIADVPEQDLALVKVAAPATLRFRAFPGDRFTGAVAFILHELDGTTRTGKVRIEVRNPDHRIKHEMFADVEIETGAGAEPRLTVPASAVIDSGNRQVVIVEKGSGLYQPRAVRLGARGDGFIEILDGVKHGESVVVAANFLIDAESNLKAALQAFTAEPQPSKVKP
jgi:Cu(I)/Ag(I) efflux system membrane fusion protein